MSNKAFKVFISCKGIPDADIPGKATSFSLEVHKDELADEGMREDIRQALLDTFRYLWYDETTDVRFEDEPCVNSQEVQWTNLNS